MKSRYVSALVLGMAGVIVFSGAYMNRDVLAKEVTNASVSAGVYADINTELVSYKESSSGSVASGVNEAMANAMKSARDVAVTVSESDANTTASGQGEDTTIYGYSNLGIAVVEGNLNVREEATTDSEIAGKMQNNAACEILEDLGEWLRIQSGKVTGYVKAEYIVTGETAAALAEEVKQTIATVTTTTLYVREEPNTDCKIITMMPEGEELEVLENTDGWIKINVDSDEGYVSADYVEISTELQTAQTMTELKYGQGVSDVRVSLVQYATQFVGNPYVWGGTSLTKGADCSGFVLSVYANYGVSLPHSSSAQANYGTSISSSEAQPGDLFFYGSGKHINHVAIYIGNGQVVHASSKKTGIKISNAYYRTPIKVVRILSE